MKPTLQCKFLNVCIVSCRKKEYLGFQQKHRRGIAVSTSIIEKGYNIRYALSSKKTLVMFIDKFILYKSVTHPSGLTLITHRTIISGNKYREQCKEIERYINKKVEEYKCEDCIHLYSHKLNQTCFYTYEPK